MTTPDSRLNHSRLCLSAAAEIITELLGEGMSPADHRVLLSAIVFIESAKETVTRASFYSAVVG